MLFSTQYDVGVDNNDFTPVSFAQVKAIIEKQVELSKKWEYNTWVICTYAHFLGSCTSVLNSAFASDDGDLVSNNRIDVWIYGHSHTNIDAEIGGTKVLSNQMGYVFQNEHLMNGFDSGKYIEIY